MSSTIFQSSDMLRQYFPAGIYAIFIATTQVIYEPADVHSVEPIPVAHCGELQLIAFWLILGICCILIAIMGRTHENTKVGGSSYDISKCFHWKFYSWDNVIHIIAALISFVALALCGHDASICLGFDPKDTQSIPVIAAAVFSLVWQALCPTQPKWFDLNTPKVTSHSGSKIVSGHEESRSNSSRVPQQENQWVTYLPNTVNQENLNVKLKQSDPSQNWIAFYATFPKYHCAAFNSIQAIILANQREWGKVVLLGLYILQSVLIIIQHAKNRSKD